MSDAPHSVEESAFDPRVDLAAIRTELAWDRTLLAWIRTTITLMGTGVALAKGAQLLHQEKVLAGVEAVRNGHFVGLALTGAGTVMFLVVCLQYLRERKMMAAFRQIASPRFPPALMISIVVLLLGCAVFAVLLIDKS